MRALRLLSSLSPVRHLTTGALALSLLTAACGQSGTSSTTEGAGATGGGAASGGGGSGAGEPGKPISIFNWNTHNYFDTKNDNAEEFQYSAADYAKKRATIGATVKAMAPDIAVLCEIEDMGILDDLNKAELADAYPTRVVMDANDVRGIDIGVLSKIPFDKVVSHKDDSFKKIGTNGPNYQYSRDCLELHLTFNGRHVILLGVHFKSKGPPDDLAKRTAEAQHTRQIADDLAKADPTAAIVVLGDFNDTPGSDPYNAIQGGDPAKFVDSADSVPSAQRYTFDFMGTLELIDHQMTNPVMAALLVPESVTIKHGKDVDDGGQFASDHAPTMATYAIK